MQSMQSQLERERQKHFMEEQKALAAKQKAEEAERERLRQEKRSAKERRRKEEASRLMKESANGSTGEGNTRHEMEKPRMNNGNASKTSGGGSGRRGLCGGWCWSMFMFLLGLFFIGLATGISLLWIYTGGRLDQKSIEKAMPIIRKDVDLTFIEIEKRTGTLYQDTSKV